MVEQLYTAKFPYFCLYITAGWNDKFENLTIFHRDGKFLHSICSDGYIESYLILRRLQKWLFPSEI